MDGEHLAARVPARTGRLASRLARRLGVTFALLDDEDSASIRARTLAAGWAVIFALSGLVWHPTVADLLADAPFNPDLGLRAVAHGWYESDHALPVTIVDIDDRTYQNWGTPAITPRAELARLMQTVTDAGPAALVVDIDLSWGGAQHEDVDAGSAQLRTLLEQYAGPAPLILPKRIEVADDGRRRMARSPLDDLIASNPHLYWAHASFETGGGGAVRSWVDWLAVCAASKSVWLPSVETVLRATLQPLPRGLERPVVPASRPLACGQEPGNEAGPQKLLTGPRMTGKERAGPRADAQTVSASLLLDPALARDDARLFGGRVVFIGSTHASAGDLWLTPSGVLPGVEMLANTVRFAPVQRQSRGWGAHVMYRVGALLLFVIFLYSEWRLRGLGVAFAVTTGVLLVLAIGLALFESLVVFDSLEAAIVLVILYKATEKILDSIEECRRKRKQGYGWWRTLKSMVVREHAAKAEGG